MVLHIRLRLVLIFGIGVVVLGATTTQPITPEARLRSIKKDLADARTTFRKAQAAISDPNTLTPQARRLFDAWNQAQTADFAAALDIAKADPQSKVGFDALQWLLSDPNSYMYTGPVGAPAIELLMKYHAGNPKVGKVVAVLAHYPPNWPTKPAHVPARKLFQAVLANNPDRIARGQAALGAAAMAKYQWELAFYKKLPDSQRLHADAVNAFQLVARDYGDCPNLYERYGEPIGGKLGATAAAELHEIRDLLPGKPASDIAGVDLKGEQFKLSDYRGKVVLLVFWASWCGSCVSEVPHEREIVTRFQGRPFALIGVNGDATGEAGLKAVTKYKINWRSFWDGPATKDGPAGTDGPISGAWNVRSWPTTYLIDRDGIIRDKNVSDKELNDILDKLLPSPAVNNH